MTQLLNKSNITTFLDGIDNVMTDCDGVLWRGDTLIPNANTTLNKLRSLGKKIFFITNNSSKSRESLVSKAKKLGFQAEFDEAISSSYLMAEHLKQIGFKGRVYVVGSTGIGSEFDVAGIPYDGVEKAELLDNVFDLGQTIKLKDDVGAVVVGFDPYFNMTKMVMAASYLKRSSCLFFCTNRDHQFPSSASDKIVFPGTGSIVKCIETGSARTAETIGKPHPRMFTVISQKFNLDPKRTVMIGDNCTTDIVLGKNCELQTLSVLTGVHSLEDISRFKISNDPDEQRYVADYYINSLGDIAHLLN